MSDTQDAAPAAATDTPAKKRTRPFTLVCVYKDDVATVYINHDLRKVKQVRDALRAQYGSVAQFHTINPDMPPRRWLEWEAQICRDLNLPPREIGPLAAAPASGDTSEPEASA